MRPVDSIPLQALSRVDGAKYQEVLVNVRRPRKVGTRGRRVEHELGDEVTNVLGVAGGSGELIKAPNAHRPIEVAKADQRGNRRAQSLDLGASGCDGASAGERIDHRNGVLKRALGNVRGGLRPAVQLGWASAGRPERVEDTAGTDRTDTIEELKQAKPAHLIGRVIGQSQESNEILDVGRAREYMARGRAIRAVGAENSITLRCRTRG